MLKAKLMGRKMPVVPTGHIQISLNQTVHSSIEQIARKWKCPIGEAARRIMILSLSGWKLKFGGFLSSLSVFSRDKIDPFQSTCLTVRNWLIQHEHGMEEALSDPDVQARLEMILDALREKRKTGQKVDLATILAEDDEEPY